MKTIEKKLRNELSQLKKILEEAKKRLKNAPEGNLRISKKGNTVEYYYKNSLQNNGKQRYMRKSEGELIRRLAQRDYDASILKNVEERIKAIETFLEKYDKTSLKGVYEKTNTYRKELIFPFMVSDGEYARKWKSIEYKGKGFLEDTLEIITENGERVRSKSEKIIADKLYALGVPYRYEYPLILEGNMKIYPDFTILKMPEREEVYLEHFGLMDDESYVEKVMWKLNTYEKNGIYLGINLFITYETGRNPLNTKTLDRLVRELFI